MHRPPPTSRPAPAGPRRRFVVAALAAAALATGILALPARAEPPAVACQGDPAAVERLELTVAGTPTWGLYAVPAEPPRGLVAIGHGYGHTAESWRQHVETIARRNGVIAVAMNYRHQHDLPPSTPGGRPSSRGWRVREGAEDTIAAARLFEANCPIGGPIVAYGVSMGGNTTGLAAAAGATRSDGTALFDYWFDIEGATNVIETYLGARALELSGNAFGRNAREDIEEEMGGPFEAHPDVYRAHAVVARAEEVAAGVKGVVMVHGVADGLVNYNQSTEMAARLRALGVPTEVHTVLTRGAGEPGTTLDGYAGGRVAGYTSPFAGHASEASSTHLVGVTGFDRLAALYNEGRLPRCAEFVVDGAAGSAGGDCPATG